MNLFQKLKEKHKVVSVTPSRSIQEAVKNMSANGVGSVLVMEGEKLVGIFTERDLVNRVVPQGIDIAKTPISEVMSKNVVTVDINDSIQASYEKMQQTKSRRVPIMENGKVVGMVTMRNLLEWLWQEIEEENMHLKRYIQQA